MKRRKDVNQGGHLRDFKLCICLNGVKVSLEVTSPASCLCRLQLVCRRLNGTCGCIVWGSGPYVSSPLYAKLYMDKGLFTSLLLSEDFGNVD